MISLFSIQSTHHRGGRNEWAAPEISVIRPEIDLADTWSFRSGRDVLEEKGLFEELPAIAEAYDTHGGGNQNLNGRRESWTHSIGFRKPRSRSKPRPLTDRSPAAPALTPIKTVLRSNTRAASRCAPTGI